MLHLFLTLPILLAACLKDETISGFADPQASYRLVSLDGADFVSRATIAFPEPGRVEGDGPCNAYSAAQGAPYPWFDIGPIGATKRACADLAAEIAYFTALSEMTLIEVAGPVLILGNDAGRQMVFQLEE